MGKMSDIHLQFSELGADEAYRFEEQINKIGDVSSKARMVAQLTDPALGPGLTTTAAHMLITGAKKHIISRMLRRDHGY